MPDQNTKYVMPIDRPKPDKANRPTNKGKRLIRKKKTVVLTEQQFINNVNALFVIAVDPDVDKSGFASLVRNNNPELDLHKLDFHDLIKKINTFPKAQTVVYIELSTKTAVWHGNTEGSELWAQQSRLANAAETGRRVGENNGAAKIIYQLLIRLGFVAILVEPLAKKKDVNGKSVKCNDADFREQTGYKGPQTCQERRDAGLIAWRFK